MKSKKLKEEKKGESDKDTEKDKTKAVDTKTNDQAANAEQERDEKVSITRYLAFSVIADWLLDQSDHQQRRSRSSHRGHPSYLRPSEVSFQY